MAQKFAKAFYNSKQWKSVRGYVLARDNYVCNKCGSLAEEVHHKTKLTMQNINDPEISLNADNLISLCKDCHFAEHGQTAEGEAGGEYTFDESGMVIPGKRVYIITGCYGSGKSTYVKQNMKRGDLVVDMGMLFNALSMSDAHDTPPQLLKTVYDTRDFLYSLIRERKGEWATAWVIAALPNAKKRISLALTLNAKVIPINTNKETCIKNIMQDETKKEKESHLQFIDEYWKQYTAD